MVRRGCCEKIGLKKGKWSSEEDEILATYIHANGEGSWRSLPKNAGLLRCGKSCRLRWINYLKPGIKRGNFTISEEITIIELHRSLGNKWSDIAAQLPGRTDNELKNYWNSHLKRKIYCFRHIFKEKIPDEITMANNTSNRNGRKLVKGKTVRGSRPSKIETQPAPHSITLADHQIPEKNNLELLLQNDNKDANRGDIGEHGSSSNMSAKSVFPSFEENIESLVWDLDCTLGKFSPFVDTRANWDEVFEGYFDQGLELMQVDTEDAWPWQW